ncbi:hypothetical protein S40293_11406 [Stachybotrys chartarum IBT 40293]|nr:hypothetical protein S40293_11406 [Stachybotrys chartarum IBT 40293]
MVSGITLYLLSALVSQQGVGPFTLAQARPVRLDVVEHHEPLEVEPEPDSLLKLVLPPENGGVERVANETLGFQKVFAVNLPERSDKTDALTLMAALTGFKIDWIGGVKSKEISLKAVPFGVNLGKTEGNLLGNWRGHMNARRRVVELGLSSALILEDDVDWDVNIKNQLQDVAFGARSVLFEEFSDTTHSPYGDDWDILWLGHCGDWFPETLYENQDLDKAAESRISAKYIIPIDPTVPPLHKLSGRINWLEWEPQTHFIHRSAAPLCSFAYAVTQEAARKLLYAMSVDGLHTDFLHSLSRVCQGSVRGFATKQTKVNYGLRCVSVNPTMIFHHKPRGLMEGDTDANTYGINGGVREEGFTESVV